MDTEKSISQLVEDAREKGKFVVLMAGEGHEKMAIEVARIKCVAATEIIIVPIGRGRLLEEFKQITNLSDVTVVIEDINELVGLPMIPKQEVFKLHAMPMGAYEPIILSDKKESFGVSKHKKSFSPPKHKGFINNKTNHRGKHR